MQIREDEIISSQEFVMLDKIHQIEDRLNNKKYDYEELKKLNDESQWGGSLSLGFIYMTALYMGFIMLSFSMVFALLILIVIAILMMTSPLVPIYAMKKRGDSLKMIKENFKLPRNEVKLYREIQMLESKSKEVKTDFLLYKNKLRNVPVKKSPKMMPYVFSKNSYIASRETFDTLVNISRCTICYRNINEETFLQYNCCNVIIHLTHIEHAQDPSRCPYCKKRNKLFS